MVKLLLVENSIVKMGNFSCSSRDVESDMASTPLLVQEKGKSCENVAESMRVKKFTYRELASATKKFKNLIGEGDFGRVYKGRLKSGEVVAVKQLNKWTQKFPVKAVTLTHSNIEAIDWDTRLKIAIGAARGLEYLHCKTNPPVIHQGIKLSNILLDNDFNPKLSDFWLNMESLGEDIFVRGISDYWPPEYGICGNCTFQSDIYSFGVVLLELISGRRAIEYTTKKGEQSLVNWSRPFLKDRKKCIQLVDPLLEGRFPVHSLHRVVAVIARCLKESRSSRPAIDEIVVAVEKAASQP